MEEFIPCFILSHISSILGRFCCSSALWQQNIVPPRQLLLGKTGAGLRGRAGHAQQTSADGRGMLIGSPMHILHGKLDVAVFLPSTSGQNCSSADGRQNMDWPRGRAGSILLYYPQQVGPTDGWVAANFYLNVTSLVLDVILHGFHFGARLKLFLHGRAVIIVPPKQTAWQNSI